MNTNNEIINSPVLQVGVTDCYHVLSPENSENFILNFAKFSEFSGCVNSPISTPALKDGAIDFLEI